MPGAPTLLQCHRMLIVVKKPRAELNPAPQHLRGRTALFPLLSPAPSSLSSPRMICIRGQEVTDLAAQSDILILCRQPDCGRVLS